MIHLKRVYEEPEAADGERILVDRLWPRGLSKEKAALDAWNKELAPSAELRKWFCHDPEKWNEFKMLYRKELTDKPQVLDALVQRAKEKSVTLLYGSRDEAHNQAVVLYDLIREKLYQN